MVRAVCQNLWGLKGDAKAEGTQGTRCARGLSMVQPWESETNHVLGLDRLGMP